MASSPVASSTQSPRPNLAFRQLRGQRSPGEFAAAVRRAAREIGERVSCDARYVGRVEAGDIRCPNYAYERVFLHMFPGRTLADLGFAPRAQVRGRGARADTGAPHGPGTPRSTRSTRSTTDTTDTPDTSDTSGITGTTKTPHTTIHLYESHPSGSDPRACDPYAIQTHEESDVRRRAFMTGSTATVATASLGPVGLALSGPAEAAARRGRGIGEAEVDAVEEAVRKIRLLDDRHGADGLYRRAAAPLRTAYALLDAGTTRQSTSDRLHAGAGELAISVGWLAHDSGRLDDARSHYAEALATARVSSDSALEAHAFCNTAFLARDAGRPREAVRAAQAATSAARHGGSHRLLSLLALREAGGWAGLGDRAGCEQSLARAHALFDRGPSDADPEWMSFYGPAELEGLEAQCWSALGEWERAARHARRAAATACAQTPQFTRNIALYTAELADDLARAGRPDEAATAGLRVLALLDEVQSSRVQSMLATTARVLLPHRRASGVGGFLERHAALPRAV
ncbi:tetratricopeptide repeat protein [Streptomyces sp. G44]|uniref:tetratricopeptide repeat protein n=1 Tax=Streptomyces sp. G44 TaxID=2807632 RepID=UPI0019613629|nr:tetratricopeptide repeat protein [Streptomyces sp. G44]MBM7167864.1 tetratricopeptide repeat protein [Streptomyces sp. G44]